MQFFIAKIVNLVALQVSFAVVEELNEIASDPDVRHVFQVNDFKSIERIREELRQHICVGKSISASFTLVIINWRIQYKIKSLKQLYPKILQPFPTAGIVAQLNGS